MSDLFTPAADWQRLPARYGTARRVGALVAGLIGTVVATVATGLFFDWAWAAAAGIAGLALTTWRVIRAGRWVRRFGYAWRDEDLLITQGLWSRQLTAIPYGRMLAVNVESGPIDRAWGLARVELVTASAQSNAAIPGLPMDEAARLRDRLIAAGEAQALPL